MIVIGSCWISLSLIESHWSSLSNISFNAFLCAHLASWRSSLAQRPAPTPWSLMDSKNVEYPYELTWFNMREFELQWNSLPLNGSHLLSNPLEPTQIEPKQCFFLLFVLLIPYFPFFLVICCPSKSNPHLTQSHFAPYQLSPPPKNCALYALRSVV